MIGMTLGITVRMIMGIYATIMWRYDGDRMGHIV